MHLFEQGSGSFLGCAGRSSGLQSVRRSDSLYRVSAFFQLYQQPLVFDKITALQVYLRGIEDNLTPCPDPPNFIPVVGDDNLGKSRPLPGATLENEQVVRFGRVAHLKLGKNRVTGSE
jgi:hypothetical protein